MKRLFSVLLVMLLCACTALAEETAVTQVRSPLYDAPRADAQELMCYVIGVPVTLTGETENGYVRVTVGQAGGCLTGWMEERDLVRGERAKRVVRAEQMHFAGTEMQTSSLYSLPDRDSAVLNDSFCLALRDVLGYSESGMWMHVRELDGSTGFVCMSELDGYQVRYELEPYVRVAPVGEEPTVGEAIAHARAFILNAEDSTAYTSMPGVYASAEKLDACTPEVEVLYYFDEPDRLTYIVVFRDPDGESIYAGLSFQWVDGEIVNVFGGNG